MMSRGLQGHVKIECIRENFNHGLGVTQEKPYAHWQEATSSKVKS